MTWLLKLSPLWNVGRIVIECVAQLVAGETCTFTFTWKGTKYSGTVKRG